MAGWKVASWVAMGVLLAAIAPTTACNPTQERRNSMDAALSMRRELIPALRRVQVVEIWSTEATGISKIAVLRRGDPGFSGLIEALEAAEADGVSTTSVADRRLNLIWPGDRYSLTASTADGRLTDERTRKGGKIGVLYLRKEAVRLLR